jgi:hypothetical protein
MPKAIAKMRQREKNRERFAKTDGFWTKYRLAARARVSHYVQTNTHRA